VKKVTQNYILVALLFLGSLVEAVSGFVLWFVLPHVGGGGRFRGAEREFWGVSREMWVDMHDWAAVALIVIVVVHIIMHWPWIVRMTKRYLRPAVAAPTNA